MNTILDVINLKKVYTSRLGMQKVQALSNVTFSVTQGEYVAIMGESGSGKTTLLNILASLDKATDGQVLLNGKDITTIPDRKLSTFRRQNLGFVFQDFNLLNTFSSKDNISLPLVLEDIDYKTIEQKVSSVSKALSIEHLIGKFPYELSGGEKQRVAIARAIVTKPQLILADEPTGALDSRNASQLLDLFSKINNSGQTIIMVTHSVKAASKANRVIFIRDGQLFHEIYKQDLSDADMFEKISDVQTLIARGGELD